MVSAAKMLNAIRIAMIASDMNQPMEPAMLERTTVFFAS